MIKARGNPKYPCLLCGWDHFTKEWPRNDKIIKFLKSNPTPTVIIDPFPSQQQLIDHMYNQGNSSSLEEICMMSSYTINMQTRQNYDKPADKKEDHSSLGKAPSTSSPESSSTIPLSINKPTLDMILRPPKSTLRKDVFYSNAWAAQFYNVVEDLAQAPCAMSTLEVLQSFPTQRKNLLIALGALDLDNH